MSKIDLEKYMNLFEKKGDYEHAILAYEKEISKHPYNDILYYRICFCAFEIHNKRIFEIWYCKYNIIFNSFSEIFQYLEIYKSYFLCDIGNIKKIVDTKILNCPNEIIGIRQGIYLYEGEYEEAIKLGNIYKKDFWGIYYYLASGYYLQGEYLKAYESIIMLDENIFPYVFDLKFKILKRLGGKYRNDFLRMKYTLNVATFSFIDYNALGNCFYSLGEYKKAIYYYYYILKRFPHDNYSYNGIGNCFCALGEYKKARSYYALGIKNMQGIYTTYSHIGIAKTYVFEGKFNKAYNILLNLISSGIKTPTLFYEISKTCFLGEIKDKNIIGYLDKAISLNKNFGAAKRLKKKYLGIK